MYDIHAVIHNTNNFSNSPHSLIFKMEKHSTVKSRKKFLNPVFHFQTKEEEDVHITKDVIKNVRKTGQLNLSGRHLATVPNKLFSIYDSKDENSTVDFNSTTKEEEAWWNMKALTNLDLSSNVLTSISPQIEIFQDLSVLNLQDNNLSSLPKELGGLNKLTKLNLNRNKIKILPIEFFQLTELKQLSISHNNLENLPVELADLVMLEKLDLSNNQINELPSGLGFLIRLTELNLSNNKITELPPDIVNLRDLLKFDVHKNSLKKLPNLGEMRKLQFLYASHNDIEEIPDFEGCQNVQELYFGNNFLKEIPENFCENMIHLKILELRDNQIKIIHEDFMLPHLIKFDIGNNELSSLPNNLAAFPHLQNLKVEGNKLKQIRNDIIKAGTTRILQHLREKSNDVVAPTLSLDQNSFPDRYTMRNSNMLNLTMKNINDIPESCFIEAKEANVTIVDLGKNRFTTIPSGLTLIAENITELNLSVNQITDIPEWISTCQKLKYLNLSNNQISFLPDILENLIYLRELVISNNRFSDIPNCVYGMVGLEILLVNNNNLTKIDVEGLGKLKRLATLDLSNNNINNVPPELGNIAQLRCLELRGNSFRQPRYAILEQGTESVLSYLRDRIPQ